MGLASTFTNSIVREIGRNYGKSISNNLLGDSHSTPVRMVRGGQTDITRLIYIWKSPLLFDDIQLGNFLFNTFTIGFEMVKDGGYCLVNISDVSIKNKRFELELDTINVLEKIGWKYQFQVGMKMNRFIGLSTENIVNRVYDEDKETYIKVEPVLVFKKE